MAFRTFKISLWFDFGVASLIALSSQRTWHYDTLQWIFVSESSENYFASKQWAKIIPQWNCCHKLIGSRMHSSKIVFVCSSESTFCFLFSARACINLWNLIKFERRYCFVRHIDFCIRPMKFLNQPQFRLHCRFELWSEAEFCGKQFSHSDCDSKQLIRKLTSQGRRWFRSETCWCQSASSRLCTNESPWRKCFSVRRCKNRVGNCFLHGLGRRRRVAGLSENVSPDRVGAKRVSIRQTLRKRTTDTEKVNKQQIETMFLAIYNCCIPSENLHEVIDFNTSN